MKIACLGWGSLIWDSRELDIKGKWFEDGPLLPVEFTRVSKDKRMTLVVDNDKNTRPVRVFWALMYTKDINEACESLKKREGATKDENICCIEIKKNKKYIICDKYGKGNDICNDENIKSEIKHWLEVKNIDAVIWTGLDWESDNNKKYFEEKRPTKNKVVEYLKKLEGPERYHAEQYVKNTPKQIDTACRRTIEKELGWTPVNN